MTGRLRSALTIGLAALILAGILAGMLAGWGRAFAADRVEVAGELARLAEVHGFDVVGLAHTEGGLARVEGDDLLQRLRQLLADYDHAIVATPGGAIERIIIIGEKAAWSPPVVSVADPDSGPGAETSGQAEGGGDIVLPTTRQGSQRAVTLSLEGEGGRRIEQSLLVDTGADYLVLPRSLLAGLGIQPQGLRDQEVQTANGKVTAKLGRLAGLWLGKTRLTGIEAAFIEDELLGGSALLGMNVLGRYRLTIDDEQEELRLLLR